MSKNSSWIEILSRGGLTVPSDQFFSTILKLDKKFVNHHGSYISFEKNVMESLSTSLIMEFPDFDPDVINAFVKTRTFIRIRSLNAKLKEDKRVSRNQKQTVQFIT